MSSLQRFSGSKGCLPALVDSFIGLNGSAIFGLSYLAPFYLARDLFLTRRLGEGSPGFWRPKKERATVRCPICQLFCHSSGNLFLTCQGKPNMML